MCLCVCLCVCIYIYIYVCVWVCVGVCVLGGGGLCVRSCISSDGHINLLEHNIFVYFIVSCLDKI